MLLTYLLIDSTPALDAWITGRVYSYLKYHFVQGQLR